MKERVANAFAYDPTYALAWVEIPGTKTSLTNASTECSKTSATLRSEIASSRLL